VTLGERCDYTFYEKECILFQIFAKYGQVLKIVTFTKNSEFSFTYSPILVQLNF